MTKPVALDAGTLALVEAVRGRPLAMVNVARTLLMAKGYHDEARALAEEACALAPGDGQVQAMAHAIRSVGVGSWYFTMVQDHGRHVLYAEAFRALLKPGCLVLDIGAGTGLFAMIAAREGAGHVIGCEMDKAVAQAASDIVAANGYADRVTILPKDLRDLEVGTDLPALADVVLWDNLANNLLGAGGVATLRDAMARLAKPDAIIIPGRVEMMVALIDDCRDADRMMGMADGFDMTPFNRLRAANTTIALGKDWALRSDAQTAFDVDFTDVGSIGPDQRDVTVTSTGGRVVGVAQWLRFHLAPGIVYETDSTDAMAFGIVFHAVTPFETEPGQQVTIAGSHDEVHSWFWIGES